MKIHSNFYYFCHSTRRSCGKFLKNTPIPDDEVFVNTFSAVGDDLKGNLKTLITSPVDENDIEPFKMIKKLYSACMNESKSLFRVVDN
jgi:hypothetical protein